MPEQCGKCGVTIETPTHTRTHAQTGAVQWVCERCMAPYLTVGYRFRLLAGKVLIYGAPVLLLWLVIVAIRRC